MLHKLQALTNNFTCQNCWQVLTFQRFFDEDHECLNKVTAPNTIDQANNLNNRNSGLRGSGLGSDIEEFKEARAMFGPTEGSSQMTGPNQSVDMGGQDNGEENAFKRSATLPVKESDQPVSARSIQKQDSGPVTGRQ